MAKKKPQSALITYCPLSGVRYSEKNLDKVMGPLESLLDGYKIEFKFEKNLLPYESLKEHSRNYDLIVLLGGDGAGKHICQAMMEKGYNRDKIVSFFPFGSGNDFLEGINISSIDDAFNALKGYLEEPDKYTKRVDVEKVIIGENVEYGLNTVGFGLNAAIAKHTTPKMKKILGGELAYYLAVFKAIAGDYTRAEAYVSSGNEKIYQDNIISLMFNNGVYAGAGMMPVPDALNGDGLIDMFAVKYMSWLKLGMMFRRVYKGTHVNLKECSFEKKDSFDVEFNPPLWMQIDGEVISKVDEAKIELIPKAMEFVYLPK